MLKSILTGALVLTGATLSIQSFANPDAPIEVNGNVATIPVELSLGLGSSVPDSLKDNAMIDKTGPSRRGGGEQITLTFREPKAITSLKLTAYSKSGAGKVLVRRVLNQVEQDGKSVNDPMVEFFVPSQAVGVYEDYQGLVMLPAEGYVENTPSSLVEKLTIVAEGFTNNDATLMIELKSDEGFSVEDFRLRREFGHGMGTFIDESGYAEFSLNELNDLMLAGRNPSVDELKGNSYVCSYYDHKGVRDVDFKTRRYFSRGNGPLQSVTDLASEPATWVRTENGWVATSEWDTNCGKIPMQMVVRMTGSGSLINETIMRKSDIYNMCSRAGFWKEAINNFIAQNTHRSVVDPQKYAASFKEFCRPAQF